MTDPLSITASIASIAAVSVKMIALVEGFISDCRNAPVEVLKLTSEIQAMAPIPRASFDQQNESGYRDSGRLEPPMQFNPSYMTDEAGDIESWKRINEMKTNIAIGSVSDSFLLWRHSQRSLDGAIPGSKQSPRRKPVSPHSPVSSASGNSTLSAGRWSPAYDEPESQLGVSSKLADSALPPTPDSGVYTADNTPTITKRTSYDEEREALERLVSTDPRNMHWLRVMLDKSNENLLPTVESVVCDAIKSSSDRILRIHELKAPIIQVPIPLRELPADESVPARLVRHNVPIIKVPTPRSRGASATSSDCNSQRISSCLTIPARVQQPSLENRTLSPQQEVMSARLSPTKSLCLPQGWEYGGSCSPNRNSRSVH
ncbi:hypothetical protein EV426DRAFT_711219 [Tirmania nivea]|nr:hypothetical protein EV426DRAFT_711219 [Tirmania nivea]